MRNSIFTLLLACVCTVTKAQDSTKVLTEGTIVKVAIQQDISSKTTNVGEVIEFITAEPVIVGDRVLVHKGTPVTGVITESERAKGMGKGGSLSIDINYLRLPSGKNVKLQGENKSKGKNATAGGMMWGGLTKKGKNVEYKKGDTFTVFVAADTVIQ